MTLLDKIGRFGRAALAAGMIYVNTVLPVQSAFAAPGPKDNYAITAYDDETEYERIKRHNANLGARDKKTSYEDDFFKSPERELEYYRSVYIELAKDNVIDSKDMKKLEEALVETLAEMKTKTKTILFDEKGNLKYRTRIITRGGVEDITKEEYTEKVETYIEFQKTIEETHLAAIRSYLKAKDERLNDYFNLGRYWHYGVEVKIILTMERVNNEKNFYHGIEQKYTAVNDCLAEFEKLTIKDPVYQRPDQNDLEKMLGKPAEKLRFMKLRDEFPYEKAKMNFWLGLLLGIAGPIAMTYLCTKLSKREFNNLDSGYLAANILGGETFLDVFHPWVYPARIIAVPILIEVIRNKNKIYDNLFRKKGNNSGTAPNNSKQDNKQGNNPAAKQKDEEEQMLDVNPWDVKVDEDEINKIKLEGILTK